MMIKKLVLFIFLLFSTLFVFAQKIDSNSNKKLRVNPAVHAANSPSNNIIENIAALPEFTTLLNALKQADLTSALESSGPVTFFAPTNEAFEKLAPGELDTLLSPAHKGQLINLLSYHIVQGKLTAKDIDGQIKAGNGQATFKTLSGGTLTARINENRNIVLTDENGRQSIVSRFDLKQSNGILHVVNMVLIPKATP